MIQLNDLQKNLNDIRKQIADTHSALQLANAKLENLKAKESQELRGLNSQSRESKKADYDGFIKEQTAQISRLSLAKKSLSANLHNLLLKELESLDPIKNIGQLNDAFPILLFPLRLEIRFKTVNGQPQLWLRVYPDDCNINHKEEILSEPELSDATSFWIEMWKAAGIEEEEKGAWKSLVNGHGSGRAEWIINKFKPINTKPVKPDSSYKVLVITNSLSLNNIEMQAARNYWAAVWLAGGVKSIIDNAFSTLVTTVGNVTAVDIKENFAPVNLNDKVPKDLANDHVLLFQLSLPAAEDVPVTKVSWTQAPRTIGLPDRFVAVAFTGDTKRTVLFDNPVKDNMPVGPDPSLPESDQLRKDENGDLIINDELQWIVDFEKAIEAGMGVKINLSADEAQNGFDKLYVTGIRITSDEMSGKEILEKMFTDHFQSKDGFGLLKQGTPTNNTEDESSGYSWIHNPDESYERIFKHSEDFNETDVLEETSDGQKLADSLGIDSSVLKKVPNANGRDQLEANAMNKALFSATLGYFMQEMMTPLFSDSDIDSTKTFFSGYVSGRGPIPAIRIGKQPYGILPVSVYSQMNFTGRVSIDTRVLASSELPYLARLHSLLMKMDGTWDSFIPEISFIGKDGDPQQILLDVVGLHANSVEFHQRYSQSLQQLYNQLKLQKSAKLSNKISTYIRNRGKDILTSLGIDIGDIQLPILDKYFLSKPNLLSGPLVDDVPPSEIKGIRDYDSNGNNYIEWLTATDADKIRLQDFGGNTPPVALLYLLLRLSLMQAQADAASNLLLSHNVISNKNVYYDPDFIHVQKDYPGKSKFEHLYNTYPNITGNNTVKLVDYIYQPAVLQGSAETRNLKETIEALQVLHDTPTARLERLLIEHLDCCNYRIDAWKTGLVNVKLSQQRTIGQENKKPSKGLYLGAYGWLLDVKPENKILTDVKLSPELNEIFNKGQTAPLQTDNTNLGFIHAPSLNQAATAAILRNAYDSNKNAGTNNPFAINLTSDRVRIADNFLEGMRNGQSLSSLLGYQFERGLHDKYSLGQGEVDKFIYPLRKAFPLVADNLKDTKSEDTDSIETIEANNVIDGLKLIHHVQNSSVKTYPFGLPASYNLPSASSNQAAAINSEVNRVMDIHDAIGDLTLSEQVYQVVQGNFERSSGNAEAFSKGSYPPGIDIMTTPRSGIAFTQRMAIHFNAEANPAVSPNSIPVTPRSKAEPGVNEWLNSILPLPENTMCKVSYSSPVGSGNITVTQKMLGLQPLDLLFTFNLDTEQAMTELDDRISNYVRYQVSHHPKTETTIKYTEPVDTNDKSKISFFELAAMIKNLRKLLVGAKYVTPPDVTRLADGELVSVPDDIHLAAQINSSLNDLISVKAVIETIQSGIVSATKLSNDLKMSLEIDFSEPATVESLILQFKTDLKEYASDPAVENKTGILNAFETAIQPIGDASKITNLKTDYNDKLNSYSADLNNLDALIENSSNAILTLARFENNQTGIGFLYQTINGIYDSAFTKIDTLVDRWEKKQIDFDNLMGTFDPAGNFEVQSEILKKAERIISSQATFPTPDLITYAGIINGIKLNFDSLLGQIKLLKTSSKTKVTDFIADCENLIKDTGIYDVISFDQDISKNNLKAEKLNLLQLKEDLTTVLENLKNFTDDKISSVNTLINEANATIVNADKITSLLNAAKKIFGEEALILPRFKMDEPQATEFDNSYLNSNALLSFVKNLEKRVFPVEDWLGGVSRVREKVHHWENLTFLSNAFNPGTMLEITPLQFPFQDNDRWVAMKFRDENLDNTENPDTFKINSDKLLYTVHFAGTFDKTKYQSGIIIDEWTEVIPQKKETTGITFHYDQPNSEPPQSMLLVVPPDITGSWKWDNIIDAMTETLEMVKKRGIEPAQIEKSGYAQFLPTTMMAVTLYWITVATNLAVNNNVYQIIEKN